MWSSRDESQMPDLAEIDRLYRLARLPGQQGRPAWRATDELINPNGAALRRAAF